MTSERLEEHEENLRSLLRDLQTQVTHTLPATDEGELKRGVCQAERKLELAEIEYSGLQSELKSAPRHFQQEYSLTMARYKNQMNSIKRQLTSYSSLSARHDLLPKDGELTNFGSVNSSYDQLLANTDTLHRASNSLARAQEVSSETDYIATGIIDDLSDQRQTLIRTRNKLGGFDAQLDQSKRLMRKAVCESVQTRFILIAIILLELLILGIVTWFKFFKH